MIQFAGVFYISRSMKVPHPQLHCIKIVPIFQTIVTKIKRNDDIFIALVNLKHRIVYV